MIAEHDLLSEDAPYLGYAYSYPHKSAYRPLSSPVPLSEAWRNESKDKLFLYLHVPFCEYRCGFCNLFTLANADHSWIDHYLKTIRNEAEALHGVMPEATFVRVAFGGGTPTFLDDEQLAELLQVADPFFTMPGPRHVPVSCEASPATLTASKAQLLKEWGVDRISLGVQAFQEETLRQLGRPHQAGEVERAVEIVRQNGFAVLNLDLIYGAAGQSRRAWQQSVERALALVPEEMYLYPLYVRELTGLGHRSSEASRHRLQHYRQARDMLLAAGYEQVSMRMFRLPAHGVDSALVYCCQTDGMVGLGCGARSYTSHLHYSTEFAVGRTGVRSILQSYLQRTSRDFLDAQHGFALDRDEQQRRFVIQSLLQAEGLKWAQYEQRFGSQADHDLAQLSLLRERGLAYDDGKHLKLTPPGMERSDVIGPWLYSPRVRELMEEFACD